MSKDYIRYDLLAQEALRGVVRQVLQSAAQQGLPGEHHFYISIDTTTPGVVMSERLRADYPGEMTVILQHQFWDLEVDDNGFSVTLSFGGNPERLVIPYAAIKGFFDPSVQFGLEFVAEDADAQDADGEDAADAGAQAPAASALPAAADADSAQKADSANADTNAEGDGDGKGDGSDGGNGDGATVVSLDAFRKKG